uniref:Cystine knot toxin n=1 Tax=Parasteatoda tepidariorum TaxID=114398 RepID=A0A2L2XXI9_PARTP
MRYLAALIFVLCAVEIAVAVEYCGKSPCGEGQCCTGSSFHRFCGYLAGEGELCEQPNSDEYYTMACPCEAGLTCLDNNRCERS